MDTLSFDFETKNELDLRAVGIDRYSAHPSCEVLMCAFKLNGGATEQWVPAEGERMPSDLKEGLRDPDVLKIAFNASFERMITSRVLDIETPYESWRCSMSLAYMFSFVGGLDDVGEQMALSFRKDPLGAKLVRTFCGPNKPTKNQPFVWRDQHSDPEKWETFKQYNIRDEDSEWELWATLTRYFMPDWQWDLYALDQLINDRGLPINRNFVQNALEIADRRKTELISEQNRVTGLVNSNSVSQLLPWLIDRGYKYEDLQKASVVRALALEEEAVEGIRSLSPELVHEGYAGFGFPDARVGPLGRIVGDAIMTQECRDVLRMRQASGKTSTTKYEACIDRLADDDRLRHAFQFAGGGRTNRWAGRGMQVHNLPRTPKWLEPEDYIDFDRLEYCNDLISRGDYFTLGLFAGEQMDAVAGCVRSSIQASEGKTLVVADLSSIESVVIGWLTGCERLLNVFREGRCAYRDFATDLFNVPYDEVTKEQRSIAKPGVLGCGYRLSGGEIRGDEKTGLLGYADNMGVKLTQEMSNSIVDIFRDRYEEIKKGWYQIEDTIVKAMRAGGRPVKWRDLEFEVKKPFLRVKLPSGRHMYYYKLHVEPVEMEGRYGPYTKHIISYMGKHQVTQQWTRIESHGGKFIENFVQAIARDILGLGLLEAHEAGLYLVGHVHDEDIAEEDEDGAEEKLKLLIACMTTRLMAKYNWIKDIPLKAAGYVAKVYRKD